ncbi:MAG: tellurite resistance TerB family protein [Planctomycetota bacterium]|jgi:tellurite resistance protein
MAFFSSVAEGWRLLIDSFRVLVKKPIFLVPIIFSWIVFASIVLYLRYYSEIPSGYWGILYVYSLIFLITISVCIANIIMLEFMQQIESGEKISFSKALKEAFVLDFLKMIPIAAIWAALWLIILILKSGQRKKSGSRAKPSPRDAARSLGGVDGPSSFFSLGLRMIEKLIRMTVFLSLPAIAWENKGPFSAIKQSFRIIKKHPVQFLTTYTLTGFIAIMMALPLCIVFGLDEKGVTFPAAFWTGVIIYEAVIWTLGIYLEQMSVALLYFWHLRWEECGSQGELSSIPRPDLLDNVYELKHLASESLTDESTESRPEGSEKAVGAEMKFRTACKSALADGKLSLDEKHELATLGKSLKMSKQDIIRIFEDEKKSFRSDQEVAPIQNVELRFRQTCREALADGKVTPEERRQLKSLAEFFKIPRELVKQMLEDEIDKK